MVEPPLLPTVETWVPPDNYIEALEAAGEDQARSIVNKAADRVREGQGDQLRVSTEIVKGHPKHAIIDESDVWGRRPYPHGLARLSRADKAVARLGLSSCRVSREVFGRDSSKESAT